MKLYQTHFNMNAPSLQVLNIPNYSTASIGVQVEKNGETISLSTSDATLVNGTDVISADSIYADHLTFPITTGSENDDKEYTLSVDAKTTIIDATLMLSAGTTTQNLSDFYSLESLVGKHLEATSVTVISALYNTIRNNFVALVDENNNILWDWKCPQSTNNPQNPPKWQNKTDTTLFVDNVQIESGFKFMLSDRVVKLGVEIVNIKQSESFNTNFKLRVNSDKSSVIDSYKETSKDDVKEIMAENTFTLSGTYTDNTTFSFTVPKVI